ncbi:hypothetical protein SAMN05444159_6373 [Bradyrhizobium lablabi]|uniref:Uncharacterized protein n=1 Tax=Bradyrhizobium lablabi TaxID=722472 RepID=A0A1M7C3T5_9BRAD|nr:hypothetical protein [Bradyrhizobium lablabi]SHL61833.1 hypothetical protein SAMN05444159_6373 [Bradyrhizobium lablabi]
MGHRLHLSALIAISLIGIATSAFAQKPGGRIDPSAAAPPPSITPAPGGSSSTATGTTGTGTGSSPNVNPTDNVPGVPDTSTPGRFGTNAAPSGLPGDDPAHPGFPGKVGR